MICFGTGTPYVAFVGVRDLQTGQASLNVTAGAALVIAVTAILWTWKIFEPISILVVSNSSVV